MTTTETIPFALAFAKSRRAEPETPYVYDERQQLNVCEDGVTLAADNWPLLLSTAPTSSTAGSKTHSDDD